MAWALAAACALSWAAAPRADVALDWNRDPASREAMTFLKNELPNYHRDIALIVDKDPENRLQALHEARMIHLDYLQYETMSAKLAGLFVQIKRREHQNYVMAEQIRAAESEADRERLFQKLIEHMDRTFDLNLQLVSGELAWLEEEVHLVRQELRSERRNKKTFIKEDMATLMIDDEPLFESTLPRASERIRDRNRQAIQALIEAMPESRDEAPLREKNEPDRP